MRCLPRRERRTDRRVADAAPPPSQRQAVIGTPRTTRLRPPAVATTNSRRQRRRRPVNCMHALVLSLQRHELSIQGGKRDCFLNAATSSSSILPFGRSVCRPAGAATAGCARPAGNTIRFLCHFHSKWAVSRS